MLTETSNLEFSQRADLLAQLARHPRVALAVGAFCLWVGVSLILRMWFIHRRESFMKKFLWSFMLLVPLFGWLFYAGCFQIPDYTSNPCPPSSGE
jgi:predicted tellurium resistance membrane protein TerC